MGLYLLQVQSTEYRVQTDRVADQSGVWFFTILGCTCDFCPHLIIVNATVKSVLLVRDTQPPRAKASSNLKVFLSLLDLVVMSSACFCHDLTFVILCEYIAL